ncbi:MarR family winged helix-turn-helix transcriptional regulator [Granulicella cerasi]|uniref:MarR family winged helix-turn-helix transcriptional regulator n=1 Tax=Granulicella cerasi TaxID=741063 RepID=A0ABW1Z9B2_9BACT|nr:MarR family transcriptional regulator [Granulicella cerasi]
MQKPRQPGEDVRGSDVWLVMTKAYHSLLAYTARTLRESGLSDSEFRLLEALLHKGAQSIHGLSERVFLSPGSVSVAVDRLLHQGFVSRTESVEDRRMKLVALTPEGKKLIVRVFRAHREQMDTLLAEVPAKERKRLAETLKTLGKRAARESATHAE